MNILDKIKQDALANHVPILQDTSMEFIELILKIARPNSILEIGSAVGYSAIKFSKYLCGKEPHIKTIELNKDMYKIATNNVCDMKLNEIIEVINADATKYLYEMDEKKEQFDVIFIDAAKGQYLIFLENAIRLAKDNAIIIADNVLFKGRVLSEYSEHKHRTATNRLRQYLNQINENPLLMSYVLDIGDGIAISVVNKNLT
ncbi:MAG: O-methyltransferase [Clostridia bacterium]